MQNIKTLIRDIQSKLKERNWLDDRLVSEFTTEINSRLVAQYNDPLRKPSLRLSQMGPRCPKALWHSIHTPELAEPLPPWANFKYSFGHIIEGLAIALAKASGHEVTGEQDALFVDGVQGHRDCVIDGCIVDVKSASSFSFKKFKDRSIAEDDAFGYLDQLDAYLVGSADDPLVRTKDRGYLLAIDKQLGHMCLYEHRLRKEPNDTPRIISRIREYKEIVGRDTPPPCTCQTIPDGKAGNLKLDTKASYNTFKHCCFPNLRTFLYANGPTYLTKVVRKPDVPEVDKHGNYVYV
jgi:hypothetical protein